MISPLLELDDTAMAEAARALNEYMHRTDLKYAAAVCISAYLIEREKQKGNPTIKRLDHA